MIETTVNAHTQAAVALAVSLKKGASRTFTVRIGNDGNAADNWSLAEARSGTTGLTRTWTRSGTNVTSQVAGGTYSLLGVAPGATRTVSMTVKVGTTAKVGQVATYALHAVHNPVADGIRDVVRIQVKVVS